MTIAIRRNDNTFLVVLVLLAIVVAGVAINVLESDHASKHLEACEIRDAPTLQLWINSSLCRFNRLVRLEDGIGNHVLQPVKRCALNTVVEVTAYRLAGDLETATAILKAKGCTRLW